MSEDADAFGYRDEVLIPVLGVQCAEGKHPDTLQPIVAMWLREEATGERQGFSLHPDLADGLASELTRWAARAREKHWE